MARQQKSSTTIPRNNFDASGQFYRIIPANAGRIAIAALIIFAVISGLVIFMDVAFSGRFIALNLQLVATGALLLAAGGLYAWLHARQRLIKLNEQAAHLARTTRALLRSNRKLNRTNESLTQSEARYRSLVDAQGDIIMRRDTRGRVTFVNKAFLEFFNCTENDVIKKHFRPDVLRGRRKLPTISQIKKASHCKKYEQQLEIGQSSIWIAWEDRLILGRDGKVLEVQTIGRDISEHRLSQLELAKTRDLALSASRAKSMFLATMSHEIRTPMNGVLGMAKLLKDTKLTQEQKTYTAAITKSGNALLTLIDNILDFSKIEADKLELEKTELDLTALVEDVTELLAPRAHAKGLDIACYVDPKLTQKVIGDETRIRQVLLNLAGNALKFTEKGSIYIKVEVKYPLKRRIHENKINIIFTIRDTGIGMIAQTAKKMFEDFTQADSTPSRKYGGTGLGLAISKRLVQQMKGTISVETRPGKGSTFKVCLPFDVKRMPSPVKVSDRPLDAHNVLVLTSGAVTGSAIIEYLEANGAKATLCCDPVGIDQCVQEMTKSKAPYTSILCDSAFEVTSGTVLHTKLSELTGDHTLPKKLVAIWPEERRDLKRLKKSGFDGYLVKPIRHKSLVERLKAIHEEVPKTKNKAQIWAPPKEKPDLPRHAEMPSLRILLAEDNDINALLAVSLLNRDGHKVIHVKNGRAAVSLATKPRAMAARRHDFDLILMDIHMPQLDGIKAARSIRKAERKAGFNKLEAVPIIALTANAFKEDKKKCLAAGMTDYLSKPVDPDVFYQVITRHVMMEANLNKTARSSA